MNRQAPVAAILCRVVRLAPDQRGQNVSRGRGQLLGVTHRLAIVRDAGRITVRKDGRIPKQGSPAGLPTANDPVRAALSA